MGKQALLAASLGLVATCAQGQEITWRVDFINVVGRVIYWSPEPDPPPPFRTITLSGLVKGEDRNRDGWIDMSEVSELRFGEDGFSGNYVTCATEVGDTNLCSLQRFTFAPDGPLGPTFEMTGQWYQNWGRRDERIARVETGVEYSYENYRGLYARYSWTEDTRLQVTQISAVPEPAGGLMLAAGLAALLGARQWRRPARITAA